jgi:hypothetical protein
VRKVRRLFMGSSVGNAEIGLGSKYCGTKERSKSEPGQESKAPR